jgi:tetratricopeptide (TPR) repeat protein
MSFADELALGLKHHQAGDLRRAEQIYCQVLQRDARCADAWHLLGVVALQSGQHAAAADAIGQAIALAPGQGTYHNHMGIVQAHLGRPEEAAASFRQAISLQPSLADAHYNLGNVLRDGGQLEDAAACFRKAVTLKPRYPEAFYNLGNVLRSLGRHREAVEGFQQALAVKPDYAKAHLNLGDTWQDLGEMRQAEACFCRVLELQPDSAKAHNNLGTVLRSQERFEEAAGHLRRAIELEPRFEEAHANLGAALLDLRRYEEAVDSIRQALALNPQYAKAHNSLGAALRAQEKIEEAMASYRRAIELQPSLAEAHTNLGCALQDLGRYGEALACFQQTLRIDPQHADAHFAVASIHLLQGRLEQGWPEYEWRLKAKNRPAPRLPGPPWDGSPLEGRSILLHAEQGMGDTLQCVRYARLVHQRGGRVTVGCPERLVRLLATCPGIDHVAAEVSLAEGFDYHAPLMSLPGIFGTTLESIPADVPYLFAEESLVTLWRERLAEIRGFRVGINWQGNPKYLGDKYRSFPLAHFEPLARVPGVGLVSLQQGVGVEQIAESAQSNRHTPCAVRSPIGSAAMEADGTRSVPAALDGQHRRDEQSDATAGASLRSAPGTQRQKPACIEVFELGEDVDRSHGAFMDTAAVMKVLDLVITSDTATAHLAGALGVPVWVALPFSPDWRWLLDREDSPWYPTMRLFRQPRPRDWLPVFERMAVELERLVAASV